VGDQVAGRGPAVTGHDHPLIGADGHDGGAVRDLDRVLPSVAFGLRVGHLDVRVPLGSEEPREVRSGI
jgi:hypothetical protein